MSAQRVKRVKKGLQKAKLLKMAAFLSAFRPTKKKKFNLNDWRVVNEVECCTTACACGYIPNVFPRSSFSIDTRGDIHYKNDRGRNFHGWDAVKRFFGLTSNEASYLFYGGNYTQYKYPVSEITPKQVAARIRSFVKEGRLPENLHTVLVPF